LQEQLQEQQLQEHMQGAEQDLEHDHHSKEMQTVSPTLFFCTANLAQETAHVLTQIHIRTDYDSPNEEYLHNVVCDSATQHSSEHVSEGNSANTGTWGPCEEQVGSEQEKQTTHDAQAQQTNTEDEDTQKKGNMSKKNENRENDVQQSQAQLLEQWADDDAGPELPQELSENGFSTRASDILCNISCQGTPQNNTSSASTEQCTNEVGLEKVNQEENEMSVERGMKDKVVEHDQDQTKMQQMFDVEQQKEQQPPVQQQDQTQVLEPHVGVEWLPGEEAMHWTCQPGGEKEPILLAPCVDTWNVPHLAGVTSCQSSFEIGGDTSQEETQCNIVLENASQEHSKHGCKDNWPTKENTIHMGRNQEQSKKRRETWRYQFRKQRRRS